MYDAHLLLFYIGQQPKPSPGRLSAEVSSSHTIRHTHPVGLLWKSDLHIAEAATYTTHTRPTSMPSAGFEPTTPAIKRLQITRPPGSELGYFPRQNYARNTIKSRQIQHFIVTGLNQA
jgi:hypothetical protein